MSAKSVDQGKLAGRSDPQGFPHKLHHFGMARVKLPSVASFSEQPHGSSGTERKEESSLWELLSDSSGGRGDTEVVPHYP